MGLFGGFKKLLRTVTKPISKIAGAIPGGEIILPAAAALAGAPYLAAGLSGATTYGKTGNLGAALGAGAGSYFGGQYGAGLGATSGAGMAGAAGPNYLGSVAGGAAGSYLGGSTGESLGAALTPTGGSSPVGRSTLPTTPQARMMGGINPASLGGAYSGLDPIQLRSKIATESIYGQGTDPEAGKYLTAETNNRLLREGGYDLLPVEEQYFQQQGYGFTPGNPKSLLEAFSRRQAA